MDKLDRLATQLKNCKCLVVGGSAGSLSILYDFVRTLPQQLAIPVILVIHRSKLYKSNMAQTLARKSQVPVCDAEDKMPIEAGHVYIAPADYHLLLENKKTFALDDSEAIKFCKPAIDVSLQSAAEIFGKNIVAIILSGANSDGADGAKYICKYQGLVVVQDPEQAEVNTMPLATLKACEQAYALGSDLLLKIPSLLPVKHALR